MVKLRLIILFPAVLMFIAGCIDPITFDTGSEPTRVVVEGLISNISYSDRLSLPNFPSRFYVRVQYTGPVNNERNDPIAGSVVTLLDDAGNSWSYLYDEEQGIFIMEDDDFAAVEGTYYHVEVRLPNDKIYSSQPEKMQMSEPLTEVKYELVNRLKEVDKGGELDYTRQEGLVLYSQVPENAAGETFYYRYRVIPSWVYVAPLPPDDSPVKTCYVTNVYYFKKILTMTDNVGDYPYELFYLETVYNTRLDHDFSAWVTQYSLSPEAYRFWDQVGLQEESGGGIFDAPPFELTTNIYNVDDPEERAAGLFSVAYESSVRFYINGSELPYNIDSGFDPCLYPPVSPDCVNCLRYRGGSSSITNIRPSWWRNY